MGRTERPPQAGMTALRYFGRAIVRALPIGKVVLGLFTRVPIAFLKFAEELVLFAGDRIPIVVSQFAPLLAHFSLHLFPIAFNAVPVHLDTSTDFVASAEPLDASGRFLIRVGADVACEYRWWQKTG